MRTLHRFLLAAACLAALAACVTRPAPGERKGRIIALTDPIPDTGGTDTVRFGRMHSGEIAVLRLWLENRTAKPVVIASYDRSCGCTSLEFDAQPITPGGAQQVAVTFDSRGERGWQLKTLDIRFAGSAGPLRLYIEAEVE